MAGKLAYHVKEYIENGRDFVMARIVATKGSSPGKENSIMIMDSDGQFNGTVGGGRIESETEKVCKRVFWEKPEDGELCHFVLNTEEEDAMEMACGGEVDILVEYIKASAPYSAVNAATNANKSETDPGKIHVMDLLVGDEVAYIFGGGHVAFALEPILRHIDIDTVIIDDREEYANPKRYPHALMTIAVEDFDNAFDDISCDENSYIIIVTRGHKGDLQVLRGALKQKCAYLGMIGSMRKNQLLYDILMKEGVKQEQINKVYAPIGELIFAETPEEIGVSIAAEIIKVRAGHGTR